jgi:hypothetical protein
MMHMLQSWFLYLKHSFTVYCSMHTALLPSPNHKSHLQDTRKSPFQWILSRRQNKTRKIQDWGKNGGQNLSGTKVLFQRLLSQIWDGHHNPAWYSVRKRMKQTNDTPTGKQGQADSHFHQLAPSQDG